MDQFIERHSEVIWGTLSGFDRLRFRGTLRAVCYVAGMAGLLSEMGILLKEFGDYAQSVTERMRRWVQQSAQAAGRPVVYIHSSAANKEAIARRIAEEDGIRSGLVCVLSCVEPCTCFDIFRNRQTKHIDLVMRKRKCLHFYSYWIDSMFGWLHVRMQSWLPLPVHICLNGREWLSRQLDAAKIGYLRRDNCFSWIEDFPRAQKLADRQQRILWAKHLDRLLDRACPKVSWLLGGSWQHRYWSLEQSEWATDIAFRSPKDLADRYPTVNSPGGRCARALPTWAGASNSAKRPTDGIWRRWPTSTRKPPRANCSVPSANRFAALAAARVP